LGRGEGGMEKKIKKQDAKCREEVLIGNKQREEEG
jgi:ubiquitin